MAFHFKQFSVAQDQCGMKVTTDACILGAFAHHQNPIKILDIGTGTGLLSLMLAQRYPEAEVHAIEVDLKAFQQAKENFSNSPFSDRLHIHHGTIQDFAINASHTFDLIAVNPPFFPDHLKSTDEARRKAFHNDLLPFNELAASIRLLLAPQGLCHILLPKTQCDWIELDMIVEQLFIQETLVIYPKEGAHNPRQINVFGKNAGFHYRRHSLTIKQPNDQYTSEMVNLMRPFYKNI